MRTPARRFGQAEFLEHIVDSPVPFEARLPLGCKRQVFTQCHVWKQSVVLKHITAVAFLGREVHPRRGVVENLVVQQDAAFVRLRESGDGIQN